MKRVIEITSAAEFEQKVVRSPTPAVVDFYSESCGPCRLLAPILEDVASELHGQVAVFKVDAIERSELTTRFGIAALPTVVLFREGQEVARLVGLHNKQRLLDAVRAI